MSWTMTSMKELMLKTYSHSVVIGSDGRARSLVVVMVVMAGDRTHAVVGV